MGIISQRTLYSSFLSSILLFTACSTRTTPTPPPASSPKQQRAIEAKPDFSQTVRANKEMKEDLLSRVVTTPNEKYQKAYDLLLHTQTLHQLSVDPSATMQDRTWATYAINEEGKLAGTLLAEVGSDLTAQGDIHKAREVYWTIIRTFTGSAHASLRQHAESRLMYLDDIARRQSSGQLQEKHSQ